MTTLHPHFKTLAQNVRALDTKVGSIWTNLVLFAHDHKHQTAEQLKQAVNAQCKAAAAELGVEVNKNSTFRVQKGLLVKAREYGVAIVTPGGKPRSKPDVQRDVDAHETPETPASKFAKLVAAALKVSDDLSDNECIDAAAAVNTLLTQVARRIPLAA